MDVVEDVGVEVRVDVVAAAHLAGGKGKICVKMPTM